MSVASVAGVLLSISSTELLSSAGDELTLLACVLMSYTTEHMSANCVDSSGPITGLESTGRPNSDAHVDPHVVESTPCHKWEWGLLERESGMAHVRVFDSFLFLPVSSCEKDTRTQSPRPFLFDSYNTSCTSVISGSLVWQALWLM